MTRILIALALLTYMLSPAHASCGTNRTADPSDIGEVSVCAAVNQYVDTESPVIEPEALAEMQAVSALEPSSGDESVTYGVTVEHDDLYTEVQSYE